MTSPPPSPVSVSSIALDTNHQDALSPSQVLPPRAMPTTKPHNDHTMRIRAKSGFQQPLERLNLHVTPSLSPIPNTYKATLLDPNWAAAMKDEFDALPQNQTWHLVPRPSGANVVSDKWGFRHKFIENGFHMRLPLHFRY